MHINEESASVLYSWNMDWANVLHCISGPLSCYMCDKYTTQKVVSVGSALMFIGVTLSAFVTSIPQMYLTFGVVAG